MSNPSAPEQALPAWLEDVRRSFVANPQLLLSGNVRDVVLLPGLNGPDRCSVFDALKTVVNDAGYDGLVLFDPIEGISLHADEEQRSSLATLLGLPASNAPAPMTIVGLTEALPRLVNGDLRTCIVIDFAARLTVSSESLTAEEHAFFSTCERLAQTAEPNRQSSRTGVGRYNQVIWMTTSDRDLPSWFLAGTDRRLRRTAVPLPGFNERLIAANGLADSFEDARSASPEVRTELETRFAEATEGVTLRGMVEVQRLARELQLPLALIDDAARSYRVGVTENPWRKPYLRTRLQDPSLVTERVLGQEDAVHRSMDIIMRSVTGLNGAQASSSATRPRGVLFFAGPTGVGKTELAKALTMLIFGDERSYVRFDMSEFSAEQAEARLIGAPPGFVGHNAGGELTNAMRERPFSLVLFDEIEKAHPRILDKFLQILEDGRLTDGAGATTFFTESVLVFTSNLGTYTVDAMGERHENVNPSMPRAQLVDQYSKAISDHFTLGLNRPELLNRLGDNIVVFNFIDATVGRRILDLQLSNVAKRIDREYKASLRLSDAVLAKLAELAINDDNLRLGGRGIGSVVESCLVNPLARAIFSNPPSPGATVVVSDLSQIGTNWEVTLS